MGLRLLRLRRDELKGKTGAAWWPEGGYYLDEMRIRCYIYILALGV